MNETYTLVGTDSSWIVAFLPVPAVIVYWLMVRKIPDRTAFGWQQAAIITYFFIAAVIGIPMTWIIAGACLAGAVVILAMRKPIGKMPVRIGFACIYLVLAYCICRIGAYGSAERIELRSDNVMYGWPDENLQFPRNSFRVDVIHEPARLNIRHWSSWTTWSKQGKSDRPGPFFTGYAIYWGPHGLIRGDDLAEHFAKWAGVKPHDIGFVMTRSKAARS